MGKVVAVIEPQGMKSFPMIMAKKIDGSGEIVGYHIQALKKTVHPGPGKGITDENEVVNYVIPDEEPGGC